MILIIEKNQKILSQLEMTSCSSVVSFSTAESFSFSDTLVFHFTRYLPPPATSQRVLRGDINTITMEELLSRDSLKCPYATGNNAFEIYISLFSPKPLTRSGQLFLSSFSNSSSSLSSSAAAAVELKIHVMDGLNYPLKQKTHVMVRFDLLTFQRDSQPHSQPHSQPLSVTEVILSTIQTNESLHPRQLMWDQKLSLSLPTKIVHHVYHTLFPSLPSSSSSAPAADTITSTDSVRYHLKISLIHVTSATTGAGIETGTGVGTEPENQELSLSPRDASSSSSQQIQAMLIKDLSEILKPLFLTNSALLASKPSFSLSSKRHEIVLPLPFEPHLLLNSSFSSTSADPSVRLRLGLLLVESSSPSDNETKSLAKARVLERFDQKSGESFLSKLSF
jgi:hypothetical protein